MGEVPDDAVDPASHKGVPGIVWPPRPMKLLRPRQKLLIHADDFIHAGGEGERLTAPRLILRQLLRSILDRWCRRRLIFGMARPGLAWLGGETKNDKGRHQEADHPPMMPPPSAQATADRFQHPDALAL